MMGLKHVLLLMVICAAGTQACDSTFTCPSDGLHADPCNCKKYYNCHAGTAWSQECAAGTLFSPTLKTCDWAANVDCDTSGTQPPVVVTTVDPGNTPVVVSTVDPGNTPGTNPPVTGNSCGKVIVCYYSNWAYYRTGEGKYTVEDIDLDLCTHLMYSFAVLDSSTYLMKAHDDWLDLDSPNLGNFRKFTALKQKKSGIKLLLALGGWNDSRSTKYSVLVASPSKRQAFISHAITFLKEYGFDGLDLDWEYPAYDGAPAADKANFATWVQELKTAFLPHGLLLTAAVGISESTASAGYDIPKISQYLDLINLMTYDMHGSWDLGHGADHQAPLYARGSVSDNLNCDYAVNYFLSNGAPANKLVLGVPVYGRSFTLSNSGSHTPPAAASAPGNAGSITNLAGYLSYLEICKNVKNGWTVKQDTNKEMGPYARSGNQWVGYDDIAMARLKAEYAVSKGLAGTMIWAIDLADFKNTCGDGKYPLLNAMKTAMDNCVATTIITDTPTLPTVKPTTVGPTTPEPLICKPKGKCKKKSGTCIPKTETCSGKIIKKGCKTKGCDCCAPIVTIAPIVCNQSKKCTKKGGLCQSQSESCDGDFKGKFCKGKTCGCCIPNK